ncbi:alpha/beta hydrolase [Arthrobacter sp. NPDC055138]
MTTSELNQIMELMQQGGPDFKDEAAKVRADFEGLLASLPVDSDLAFETRNIGGIEGVWLTSDENPDRVLLYLHGGAYVVGTAFGYRSLACNIARAAGVSLFAPEYRLAPEHRYPAAIDDALAAYRGLLEEGFAPGEIVLAGDSAGGGLTAALLVAIKGAGLQQPAGAWLLSPWADLALTGESVKTKAGEDKLLDEPGLRKTANDYLNGTDPRSPLASPIYADLSGLAPLFIHAGSAEILLDDAVRLAARAGAAGTSARLEIGPNLFHDWPLFAFMLSEGRDALAAAGEFLAARLDEAAELEAATDAVGA